MTAAATRLLQLQAMMETIRAALESDDLAPLPALVDRYGEQVEQFCALPDARLHRSGVRALYDFQQQVLLAMQERKTRLQGLIRHQRQSSQAASAYARAATAP